MTATGTPTPTIMESGQLPNGVHFDQTADELTGTPTEAGMFPITLTAFNGVSPEAVQSFTLTVLGFHITTTTLGQATRGVRYSTQLEAAGGVAPYRWARVSGQLPRGFSLSPRGMLSGTTGKEGTFTFTVKATDASGAHQTAKLTLQVD